MDGRTSLACGFHGRANLTTSGYSFTFTVSHADRTASCSGDPAPKSSLAEAAVALAKAPKVAFGLSVPPVRVTGSSGS